VGSSSGVSLREWAALMVGLGGVSALNLDGGFSTSIHIALDGQRLDVHPHGATINAVVAR
jgi:exopolysaccharide biosynthesis protein